MTNIPAFANTILDLIGKNELKAATQQLQQLLQSSPLLDEAIGQSARLSELMQQIQRGTINVDDANVEKNKLRYALIDLVREVEEQAESNPVLKQQVERVLNEQVAGNSNQMTVTGNGNIAIQDVRGSEIKIQTGGTVQQAEKIYNIDKIDKADFS
ncbi:hypothetical protein [Haliscomenobacter sp.]|uniref:hypothetical protein n=1 Tax=Haliscomenobacter sp. TaxID=2717303 RepID=UPI00359308D5